MLRILYVEYFLDEAKENTDLLRQALSLRLGISENQIEITEAIWFDDALNKLTNCQEPPDAIILGLYTSQKQRRF